MDRRASDTTREYQPYQRLDGSNPLPPPAPRGNPAIRLDVARSVRLHPVLFTAVAATTFVLVAGFALTRKPVYKAESLVYVEPIAAKLLSDGSEGLFDSNRYESYLQQQIQTVQRPDILQAAVESLPPGTWRFPGESVSSAAARLGSALKVERQGTSFQVSLSLLGPDPNATAATVNAATAAYLQKGRKDETTRTDGRVQLLNEEKDRLTAELQTDRAEQVTLGGQLGVANPVGPTADAIDTDLGSIRAELVAARQAHDVAAAQLASVSGPENATGMASAATTDTAGDPGLQALKTSFSQRRAALTSEMSGLTAANPIYRKDQAELAQLDQQLAFRASLAQNTSSQQIRDRLRLELKRTGDVEARLNGELAAATARAGGAAPRLQRASELAADIERLQSRYTAVDSALRSSLLEANGPGTVHLSVPATPPASPEPSRRNLLLAASLPLALLFGILAAVFARRRAGRVYNETDLEPILGFTPLGVMPAGYLGTSDESLLRLAAGLERAHRRGAVQTFVFTAATPSTDTAPFSSAMQRELESLGFRTTLKTTGELRRAWEANSPSAEILPSGQRLGIDARLAALKQGTDFILIEAPPLLHSAEAEYFISAADITVLLIESGVTTVNELNPAMDLLRKLRISGLAAVLLNVPQQAERFSLPVRSAMPIYTPQPANPTRISSSPKPMPEAARMRRTEAEPVHDPAPVPPPERAYRVVPQGDAGAAATPDPTPEPDPTPTPSGSRWSSRFFKRSEPAASMSFIPSFYDGAEAASTVEPAFAEAASAPLTQVATAPSLPTAAEAVPVESPLAPASSEPNPASQTQLTPVTAAPALPTLVPPGVPDLSGQTFVFAESDTTANVAEALVHPVPEEHVDEQANRLEPAAVQSKLPTSTMLLWEAHIRHRAAAAPQISLQSQTQSQTESPSAAAPLVWAPFAEFRPTEPSDLPTSAHTTQVETPAPSAVAGVLSRSEAVPAEVPPTSVHPIPELAFTAAPTQQEHAVHAGSVGQSVTPVATRVDDEFGPSVDTLMAARSATSPAPRRLPSSAERLAFRANVPAPRRPSLSSMAAVPPPVPRPSAPRLPAESSAANTPHLVASSRASGPASRSLSAAEVAERIVGSTASAASGGPTSRSHPTSRPRVMPFREEPHAATGRRWAMLSRFSKEPESSATGAQTADAPRDRAAG